MDLAVEKIQRAKGTAEHWELQELSNRLETLLPLVDTVPLPKFARRAGRNVGDFFYLLQASVGTALEKSSSRSLPTVREARKYDANPFEASVHLGSGSFEKILLYRAKARETLRKPAKSYGQSCEQIFVPHSEEDIQRAEIKQAQDDEKNWAELDVIFADITDSEKKSIPES